MKRIIFILSFVFITTAINAQQAGEQTPEQQRAHTMALRLKKLVSATDEQTQKAEVIFLSRFTEINAVIADTTKTAEEQNAAIEQINTAKENELATVLTPEQFIKYQEQRKAAAARQTGGQ